MNDGSYNELISNSAGAWQITADTQISQEAYDREYIRRHSMTLIIAPEVRRTGHLVHDKRRSLGLSLQELATELELNWHRMALFEEGLLELKEIDPFGLLLFLLKLGIEPSQVAVPLRILMAGALVQKAEPLAESIDSHSQVVAYVQEALRISGSMTSQWTAKAHEIWGRTLHVAGQNAEALTHYRKAVEEFYAHRLTTEGGKVILAIKKLEAA